MGRVVESPLRTSGQRSTRGPPLRGEFANHSNSLERRPLHRQLYLLGQGVLADPKREGGQLWVQEGGVVEQCMRAQALGSPRVLQRQGDSPCIYGDGALTAFFPEGAVSPPSRSWVSHSRRTLIRFVGNEGRSSHAS